MCPVRANSPATEPSPNMLAASGMLSRVQCPDEVLHERGKKVRYGDSSACRPTGFQRDAHRRDQARICSFTTVEHDGKIRMNCSSPYAMARLVGRIHKTSISF